MPTQWCAALNIDSLALNPVTGQLNNSACENKVGEEYVNFAFITKNGSLDRTGKPGRRDDRRDVHARPNPRTCS